MSWAPPPTDGGVGEGDDLGQQLLEVLRQILAAVLAPPGLVPGLGELGVAGQDEREGPELDLAVRRHGCQGGCQLGPNDVEPPGQDVQITEVPPTGVGSSSRYFPCRGTGAAANWLLRSNI